jgi:hypothetical protein
MAKIRQKTSMGSATIVFTVFEKPARLRSIIVNIRSPSDSRALKTISGFLTSHGKGLKRDVPTPAGNRYNKLPKLLSTFPTLKNDPSPSVVSKPACTPCIVLMIFSVVYCDDISKAANEFKRKNTPPMAIAKKKKREANLTVLFFIRLLNIRKTATTNASKKLNTIYGFT